MSEPAPDIASLRWQQAGRRLRAASPERFREVMRLLDAYLAALGQPDNPERIVAARLAMLDDGRAP